MGKAYFSLDNENAGDPGGVYSLLSIGLASIENPDEVFYRELAPINFRYEENAMRVGSSELDCLVPFLHVPNYNPKSPQFQPDRVLELLGRRGITPKIALDELLEWVSEQSNGRTPVIVTDVPDFDFPSLKTYLAMHNKKNPFGHYALALKPLYQGMMRDLNANPKDDFKIENKRPHHAGSDAQYQAKIANAVGNLMRKNPFK